MKTFEIFFVRQLVIAVCICIPLSLHADDSADLAKKLANPVASLISIPLQYNFDDNYGIADNGSKNYVNIQPVIPISLNEDLNIISRTILPVVSQNDLPSGSSEAGLGDTLQSFFFSPKEPTCNGLIWGVGPAFFLPSATDKTLGTEKWSAGPTFVGLKQEGPWTFGVLANHLWSFAGDEDRQEVNSTYIQPFLSYITATHSTFALNTESTYNWVDTNWSVPLNFTISQILKIANQPIQISAGPRYWIQTPDSGPEGWGVRAMFTFLFPK